jgi:uncharacterized protein YdhG (YjbR/CyaY superfamily)
MQSTAETVDAFLKEHPEPVRGELRALRRMIRETAPHAIESMRYGMPVYSAGERMVCGFNKQKDNLAFYVGRVPDAFRARMKQGFSLGKGCVRFKTLDGEKRELLAQLLETVVREQVYC